MLKKLDRPQSKVPSVRVIRYADRTTIHISICLGFPGQGHTQEGKGSIYWYKPKSVITMPDIPQINFAWRGETVSPRLASIFSQEWFGEEGDELALIEEVSKPSWREPGISNVRKDKDVDDDGRS